MKQKILISVVVPLLLLSALSGCTSSPEKGGNMKGEDGETTTPAEGLQFIFKDHQYSFQALRAISQACNGGADIGECLSTIYKIEEGDDESWYREWLSTAQRVEKMAQEFQNQNDQISAGE